MEDLTPSQVRVLLALIALRERSSSVSVRDVAAAVGLSVAPTYANLLRLRVRGFVAWEPRRAGTLRPLVRRAA